MATLSAGDLANLRVNHPHVKKTYASPVKHVVILQARVNSPGIGLGAMSIPYDSGTGTAANYALVEADQIVLVGSTLGADDLGIAYIRSITGNQVSGTISVAWNSDVDWADNAYLSVIHTYWVRPKFPKLDDATDTHYKDKDIAYTDENTYPPPVAIMGCGWAGMLTGATITTNLVGSSSYVIASGATISSYLWSVATSVVGATPSIASSGVSTTTITFDRAGLYWVKLTVTDSNGKTQSTVRPFIVHDDSYLPYYIEEASRSEVPESGGVNFSFTVNGLASVEDIPNNTPIIIWSSNVYNGATTDVSYLSTGEYAGRTHIDFFGYIDSVAQSFISGDAGTVSFTASTVNGKLGAKFMYSIPIIAEPSVTEGVIDEWWKYPADKLTTARALHFLWKWHSTLFEVADVYLPITDTRIRAGCQDFTLGSLWDRASSFAKEHSIFAKPSCSIYGGVHADIDIQMLDTTDRAAITDILTLQSTDWQGDISIVYRMENEVAIADVSGTYWSGTELTGLLSKFGEVSTNAGTGSVVARRIVVNSQSHINKICGRLVAIANNSIVEIRLTLTGNWSSAIGATVQEWVRLTLTGTEPGNNRGLVLDNVRLTPIQVDTTFNEEFGVSTTTIILEPEAFGRDGIDGDYPVVPTTGGTTPTPGTPIPSGSGMAAFLANSLYYLAQDSTSWVSRAATTVLWAEVDPYWQYAQSSEDPADSIVFRLETGKIYRSVDAGENWTDVTPSGDPPNTWGDSPAPTASGLSYVLMRGDVNTQDTFWVGANWENGDSDKRYWLLKSNDSGVTWGYPNTWWLSGGLESTDCVAAYQAAGATSFANSLVNLNDPGTNDLVSSGSDPSLTADGWEFTGSEQIDSIITPDESTSIFICVSDLAVPDFDPPNIMAIAGTERASNTSFNFYYSQYYGVTLSVKSGSESLLAYGSKKGTMAGVLVGSNRVYYANGVAISTESSVAFTSSQPFSLGAYTGYTGVPIYPYLTGTIKALAIYNRTFTESEAFAVQASMMALFGD